jgi:hypothetical protein
MFRSTATRLALAFRWCSLRLATTGIGTITGDPGMAKGMNGNILGRPIIAVPQDLHRMRGHPLAQRAWIGRPKTAIKTAMRNDPFDWAGRSNPTAIRIGTMVTGARVMRHRLSRTPQLLQLVRSVHRVVTKRSVKRNIPPDRNVQSRYVTKPRAQRRSQATTRVTLLADSLIACAISLDPTCGVGVAVNRSRLYLGRR